MPTQPTKPTISCAYSLTTGGLIQLTVTVLTGTISSYFELNIPQFLNPSSTTSTSSFTFASYSNTAGGKVKLDYQSSDIIMKATTATFQSITLSSSSQVIGNLVSVLTVTLTLRNPVQANGNIYITFPLWNLDTSDSTQTTSGIVSVINSSPTCTGQSNIKTSLSCSFDSTSATLTIPNAFAQSYTSGTVVSFQINSIKNPISQAPATGFIVSTGDSGSGLIDKSTASLTVLSIATISNPTLTLSNYTVQQYTTYTFNFDVPVPLRTSCLIYISFPIEMTLDSHLASAQGYLFFGFQYTFIGTVNTDFNTYQIQNACPKYMDNSRSAQITLSFIQNPFNVMTSSSIEIFIYDSAFTPIASTNTGGPTVTTIPDGLSIQSLTADNQMVDSVTNLAFSIVPNSKAYKNSYLQITLPAVFILPGACVISGVSNVDSTISCSITGSVITINNMFLSDYSGTTPIKFKLSNIQMPPSSSPTSPDTFFFQLFTFSTLSSSYALLDQLTATNLLASTPGYLPSALITPTSYVVNDITSYKVEFKIAHRLLLNSIITVVLPPELSLTGTNILNLCSSFSPFLDASTTCSNSNLQTVTVTNWITTINGFTDLTQLFGFTISHIQNPRSVQTTSSFQIYTKDSNGYVIDQKTDNMAVTMNQPSLITSATVTPTSLAVGSTTSYQFKVQTSTSLVNGDQIYILFPASDIGDTLTSTLASCKGLSFLFLTLTCSASGPYGLYITVKTSGSQSSISANTMVSFQVNGVKNPLSTKPTALFSLSIYDSKGSLMNAMNPSLTQFYAQMQVPEAYQSVSVSHLSRVAMASTSFIFVVTLLDTMKLNGQMIITYPAQITLDYNNFGCSVDLQASAPICSYSNARGNNNITLQNLNSVDIQPGIPISVTLTGLINSQYSASTDSFSIFTYTSDGYSIAQQTSGLTVTNDCDYPCYTCMTGQPSKCLSCLATSTFSIYSNNQCLSACPLGQYAANNLCYQCDKSCLSCQDSATHCTSCSTGLYLLNNLCLSSCPQTRYFQNSQTYTCQSCASPCYSCSSSPSTCSSCLQNITQNLYFQGSCYTSCPSDVSVNSNGACLSCSDNCKTCIDQNNICTSCQAPKKLDYTNRTCVDTCPVGTTVDMGSSCALCDLSCKTCAPTSINQCLTCQQGLFFNEVTSKCVTNCPKGTAGVTTQPTLNTTLEKCQKCDLGCSECEKKTNYCTKCDDSLKYLFFNFSCVYEKCPGGYTRLNETMNVCVRDGLVCDYGYEFNQFGECVLGVAQCKKGYVLNRTKDRCIPKPFFYIPFLFTALALAWMTYVLVRAKKPPKQELHFIIAQLLVGFCLIQSVSYYILFGLSIWLGYRFITAIHILGLLFMVFSNIIGSMYFKKKISKDSVFSYWKQEHKVITRVYTILACLVHFKVLRGIYSKLFKGKNAFSAVFSEEYENMVRPLFILTLVNLVVQVIPIMIIDVYTLILIPWGYQIMVMSIDNLILSLAMFVLEVIEFRIQKRLYIEQGGRGETQQLVGYKSVKGEHDQSNVMNAMAMDDESLKAIQGYKDQTLDLINQSEGRFLETKQNKSKLQEEREKGTCEAKLLENLIRKIGEERKFNDLNEDDEIMPHSKSQIEEELSLRTSNKQNLQPLSVQGQRYAVEQLRERIENKLLKKPPLPQATPTPLEEQLKNLDLGLTLSKVSPSKDPNSSNMESARTEKFAYQQDGYPLTPREIERIQQEKADKLKKQAEEYNQFFDEIKEKLDKEFMQKNKKLRNWHSFDGDAIRDWFEEMEPESDFGETKSNTSFPMKSNAHKMIDPEYLARLEMFREKVKSKYQYNNLYAERFNPFKNQQDSEFACRRTQTYEKDVNNDAELFTHLRHSAEAFDEDQYMELEPNMAHNLIGFLLERISETDLLSSMGGSSKDFNEDGSERGGKSSRRELKGKKRKRDIQFEIDDIMGTFEIDDYGNVFMDKERKKDNFNRKINKHGYLVDQFGNVINQEGQIIFEVEELDSDEDIPLPYKFERRKKQLLRSEENFNVDPNEQHQHFEDDSLLQLEEDKVDDELTKLQNLSKRSSVDSQMGESPSKFDQMNQNEELDQDDQLGSKRGKKSQYSRKELELARAYGGSPQPKKVSKKRKRAGDESQASNGRSLERQATDRLFPSLMQEEERVRKLQNLSNYPNKTPATEQYQTHDPEDFQQIKSEREEIQLNQGKDLEEYFKEQLMEMNEFREKDREELKKQMIDDIPRVAMRNNQDGYAIPNAQDSATTTRSITRGLGGNNTLEEVLDPLQQFAQFDSQSLQQYMPVFKFQNAPPLMKNAALASNNNLPSTQPNHSNYQKPPLTQQKHYTNYMQNQNQTINSSGGHTQEDLSPLDHDERAHSSGLYNYKEERKTFGFYLPTAQEKLKPKKHTKSEVKRKDTQLTNAGQLTIQGDSRLKEMEGIYLKKYGAQKGHSTIATGYSGQRAVSSMRNNNDNRPIQLQHTSQGAARFRPLQHNFGEDPGMISGMNQNDFQSVGGENDDFDTVFGGMQKAMTKIEQIRQMERQKGVRMQRTLNASSSAMDRQRLNVQNNNWVV